MSDDDKFEFGLTEDQYHTVIDALEHAHSDAIHTGSSAIFEETNGEMQIQKAEQWGNEYEFILTEDQYHTVIDALRHARENVVHSNAYRKFGDTKRVMKHQWRKSNSDEIDSSVVNSRPEDSFWYDYIENKYDNHSMKNIMREFSKVTIGRVFAPIVAVFVGFLIIQTFTIHQLVFTTQPIDRYFNVVVGSAAAAGLSPIIAYWIGEYMKIPDQDGSDTNKESFVSAIKVIQESITSFAHSIFTLIAGISQIMVFVLLEVQHNGSGQVPLELFVIPVLGVLLMMITMGDKRMKGGPEEWENVIQEAKKGGPEE